MTIADNSPEALVAELLAAHPGIAAIPGLQLGTWQVDVASLGTTDRIPPDVTSIYVCLASETRALTAALALRQQPGLWDQAPIVVAVADEHAGVGATIARAGHTLDHVTAFGVLSRTLRPEALLRTATEKIARLGHQFHCREQFERGVTQASDPSLVRWEELSPDLRESNRLWADGIAAHLSDLGLVVAPSPLMLPDEPAFEFADDEVERLAPLEHARWENAMTRIGYRHGPTRTNRTHPLISVPFDELPEENKNKDRAHVRAIPAILAQAGFRISRPGAGRDRGSHAVEVHAAAPGA